MKNHRIDEQIEAAMAREDWTGARKLILRELQSDPDDHWLLARLSTTYYEERDYATALRHIEEACRIVPNCPLVLWDYAGTLDATGESKKALQLYDRLLAQGPRALGNAKPCGEGIRWALSLLVDCVFRSGVCWEHLGATDKAGQCYLAFLDLRVKWRGGLYSFDDVRKRIMEVGKDHPGLIEKSMDIVMPAFDEWMANLSRGPDGATVLKGLFAEVPDLKDVLAAAFSKQVEKQSTTTRRITPILIETVKKLPKTAA